MGKIDLNIDWVSEVKIFLANNDFKKFQELSNNSIAIRLSNYFRKGGMDFNWEIMISKDFFEKHCLDNNEKMAIYDILNALKTGKGAYEYLSLNSKNFSKDKIDFLFNRWEISHFHLDKSKNTLKNKRSEKLLFIYFDYNKKSAKVIGIYDHKKWFANDVFIEFINLYPEVISNNSIGKKVIKIVGPDLYKSKANFYLAQIIYDDGTSLVKVNNAVVSTGDAEWDVRIVDRYFECLGNLSNRLNRILENYDKIIFKNTVISKDSDIHLKMSSELKMNLIDKTNNNYIIFREYADAIMLRDILRKFKEV